MSSRGDNDDNAGGVHGNGDDGGVFTLPTGPAGPWDQLTSNEQAWIEFIRVISCGSDPKITPKRVTALMALLDVG